MRIYKCLDCGMSIKVEDNANSFRCPICEKTTKISKTIEGGYKTQDSPSRKHKENNAYDYLRKKYKMKVVGIIIFSIVFFSILFEILISFIAALFILG